MAQALHAARVAYQPRPFVTSRRGDTRPEAVIVPIREWDRLVEAVNGDGR
jgi:hypothetical protein